MSAGEQALPQPRVTGEDVREHQRTFRRIDSLLTDVGGDVDDANLTLEESWRGEAATSCVSDVRVLRTLLKDDATAAADAAAALGDYARAVDSARADVTRLQGRYDDEVAELDRLDDKIPRDASRWEREEWRDSNRTTFEDAVRPLRSQHAGVLEDLATAEQTCARALQELLGRLSPESMRGGAAGGDPDVDVGGYQSVAFALSLAATMDTSPDADQRVDQVAAFVDALGRPPTTPTDWQTAAMLNPENYQDKYRGVDSGVYAGRITPQPGKGVVRIGWFIPVAEVYNPPKANDLGDDRGFDPSFLPEETRVAVYVDYENGLVIARNNPSVATDGTIDVGVPEIKVQQHPDGRVRLFYNAMNPLAPSVAEHSSHTVHGDIVINPPSGSQSPSVDGRISSYPSFEAYHSDPQGVNTVVAQDAADDWSEFGDWLESAGPMSHLWYEHEVGDGGPKAINDFYQDGMDGGRHDFEWRNPNLSYPDAYPMTDLGDPAAPPSVSMVGR